MVSVLRVIGQRSPCSLLQRDSFRRSLPPALGRVTSSTLQSKATISCCRFRGSFPSITSLSSLAVKPVLPSVISPSMSALTTPMSTTYTTRTTLWQECDLRSFSSTSDDDGTDKKSAHVTSLSSSSLSAENMDPEEIMSSFQDTSYFDHDPLDRPDFSNMTNQELEDVKDIPGWDLIHSPPQKGKLPKGALVGKVVSTKMQKTVNVAVDRYRIAPIYRKRMRYTRKFMAHDEQEVAKDGDLVMIVPCHRISKHKHFMLREIVRPKGQL